MADYKELIEALKLSRIKNARSTVGDNFQGSGYHTVNPRESRDFLKQ